MHDMLKVKGGFMHRVNIDEATAHLPDLIDAAVGGEEIVIAKDDQTAVKLARSKSEASPEVWQCKGIVHDVR
jgi:hypothetical protein